LCGIGQKNLLKMQLHYSLFPVVFCSKHLQQYLTFTFHIIPDKRKRRVEKKAKREKKKKRKRAPRKILSFSIFILASLSTL